MVIRMYKQEYIPNIRFVEFTTDWEKHTLKDCTDKIGSGKTPKGGSSIYEKSGIPLLRSQNIHSNKVNFEDVVYITEAIDKEMSNSRVKQKDVLLNITGASIGRSAVYFYDKIANVNQHVCIIRPNSNVDSNFIQLNITSSKGQKQINLNQAGGGREGLNFQQIAKISFYYPKWKEQKKIGSFFNLLDDAIFFQQQLLNDHKQLKKAMLQKMFPQKGETIPKVRFSGYTDDWEEKMLKDVIEKQIKGKTQLSELSLGKVEYLDASRLNGGTIFLSDGEKNVVKEDILILWDGSKAGTLYKGFEGTLGSTLKAYSTGLRNNSEFVYQYLLSNQQVIYTNYRTPNIPHVVKDFAEVFPIIIPVFEEQEKIGHIFKKLDETIELHQKKLETYQELKKAMLQKMFV